MASSPPKLVMEPRLPVTQILSLVASMLQNRITKRAFPADRRPGTSVDGKTFKPLSARYARYKSGAAQFGKRSKLSWALRTPPKGWGPRVKEMGISRRLSPRSSAADQRLTNQTAQGFGVVRQDATSVTLGFRDARSQAVAWHLERRNQWFGASADERRMANVIFDDMVGAAAKNLKILNPKLTLNITIQTRT